VSSDRAPETTAEGGSSPSTLHLAVALDGTGWHPAAWRDPTARPADLFAAEYWVDLVRVAERGLVDFVTIEDSLRLQSDRPFEADRRTDRVRGRLDAVQIAARVAPLTRHVGLVPTAVVTHTEPFHLSKAIATLDYVSEGRAGVRVQVSGRPDEARHFGRRQLGLAGRGSVDDLFDEAEDWVEVVRRLWDSWEDDAEIRDVVTGRFVDRNKLHYIDFRGRFFSVRGPSITPRPPQGQPIVAALAHRQRPYELIARSTDVGFVTPTDSDDARGIVNTIATEAARAGRQPLPLVLADLVVFLDGPAEPARVRKERLDGLLGREYRSDAAVFVGSAAGLADLMGAWAAAGLSGFRLRPASLPTDAVLISDVLVPELQRRGRFRTAYTASSLRGHLGLTRPANRFAVASTGGRT
jgi:alkanesulfonate monooxygenase SsuD/methylene tetrahydromethanopterin reductase-like flavin-dependent oxidoreductase (luciferase family)